MNEAALLDEALLAWFPPTGSIDLSTTTTFTETDLRDISDLLYRSGKPSWSRIPRIYTTLRLIDEVDVIDAFLDRGITDLSLPFKQRTLPGQLKDQSSRARFLNAQSRVLTKALNLEKEGSRHRHFSQPEEVPLKKIAELGKGGYGYVDKVLSTVSYREYARKLIPRGRTFRQDRTVLQDFEKELQVLKKLSHQHIVRLIGSYTDPQYVGIIMTPVADCNLKAILNTHTLSQETHSRVRTFYGCLASALRYLHENKLRHKDIKPENVLVKSHEVYLTDFGTTLDWSDVGHSTTTGPASKGTIRYCAPEVAASLPRKSSADIWSLGCVFLEIWTKLCGPSMSDLDYHMEFHGSGSSWYYANHSAVTAWCDVLSSRASTDSQIPDPWIRSMLQTNPAMRCSIQSLVEEIHHASSDPEVSVTFAGLCCNEEHNVAETVVPSVYQASEMGSSDQTIVLSTRSSVVISTSARNRPPSTRSSAVTSLSARDIPLHNRPFSRPVPDEIAVGFEDGRSKNSPASTSSKTTASAQIIGTNPSGVDRDMGGLHGEKTKVSRPTQELNVAEQPKRCRNITKSALQFPDASDKRKVNDVLREWLDGFANDPFWSFTILEGFARYPGHRLLHKLGGDNNFVDGTLQTLSESLCYESTNIHVDEEFTQSLISIMDRIDIPYVVYNNHFVCFYPDGILPDLEENEVSEVDGVQALRTLDESRHKVLEWWYDCLTAPRQMWYERLMSTRVVEVQLIPLCFSSCRIDYKEDCSLYSTSHRQKDSRASLHIGASFEHLRWQSKNSRLWPTSLAVDILHHDHTKKKGNLKPESPYSRYVANSFKG